MDTVDSAITKPVRRLQVFTGAGRRRTWSDEDKARIVAEIERRGDSVSSVARQHGLSPEQLFGWRRRVREADAAASGDDLRFVPAVVDAAPCDTAAPRQSKTRAHRRDGPFSGTIDVAIDGVTVRTNDMPGCSIEQAVNATLKDVFDDAERLLLKRLAGVTLGEIARSFPPVGKTRGARRRAS